MWVGAGVVTAGVSAALLSGAGLANADTGSGSDSGDTSSSASTGSDAPKSEPGSVGRERAPGTHRKPRSTPRTHAEKPDAGVPTSAKDKDDAKDAKDGKDEEPAKDEADSEDAAAAPDSTSHGESVSDAAGVDSDKPDSEVPTSSSHRDRTPKRNAESSSTPTAKPSAAPDAPADTASADESAAVTDISTATDQKMKPDPSADIEQTPAVASKRIANQDVSAMSSAAASPLTASLSAVATPAAPTVLGVIQGLISAVIVNVGSLVFNTLQAVEALVTGPPVLPPGSTVTVRSSTVQLSNGQRVATNWYYPTGDTPPTNMILLQHGFFALGPMYSYTAANLADETHSVVVTTTLSSNPFAGDSFWLGGTGMSATIADLFVGNRAALTASAIDAGYATRYGLDPQTAQLPQKFALAGHSLGANLVSGAAGFLVDKGAADDLVGVILLDGVPTGKTLPDALAKLDAYAGSKGGHYVPVREIGAPLNLFNSASTVNQDLTAARPDRFNGVVLDGGVHMDSMQGGNPLIQFVAYLVAGFPQPQNPPAVAELSATWLNQWFAGDTDADDDLEPGSAIDVTTDRGTATGVVIGNAPAAKTLTGRLTIAPSTPTTIPAVKPELARLAA